MKGGTGVTGAGEGSVMVLCPIIVKEGRWSREKSKLSFQLPLGWQLSICEEINKSLHGRCVSWTEVDLRVMGTDKEAEFVFWVDAEEREALSRTEPRRPLERVGGVAKAVLQMKSRDMKHCVQEAWKRRGTTGFLWGDKLFKELKILSMAVFLWGSERGEYKGEG